MCATLSVASPRCAGRGTAICCAGPLLSLLRPIAMLRIKHRAARPKLRAAEQRAGGGPRGAPKKRPWTAIRGPRKSGLGPLFGGPEIAAHTRCQTEIAGRGAARWRGPPGCPEKAAWDRYSGGAEKAALDRYSGGPKFCASGF